METENNELLDIRSLVQSLVTQTIDTAYKENENKGLKQNIAILEAHLEVYKLQVNQLQTKLLKVEKFKLVYDNQPKKNLPDA